MCFPLFLPCLEFFHSMNDFLLAGIVTLAYPILIADPTEAVNKDYSLRSLPSGVQAVSSLNLCFFGVHDQEESLARGQHHLPSFAFLHSSCRELLSMPCTSTPLGGLASSFPKANRVKRKIQMIADESTHNDTLTY